MVWDEVSDFRKILGDEMCVGGLTWWGKAGSKGKATQSVRRILMSQKTFANHIADEEAAVAAQAQQSQSVVITSTPRAAASRVLKTPTSRLKRSSTSASASASTSTPVPTPPSTTTKLTTHTPLPPTNIASRTGLSPGSGPSPDDKNPLLRSYIPAAPSEAVLRALVSAPPLSYTAARALPSSSGRPQRRFCEICGYWGRVKCLKCGARVCGLECKGVHDDGRCLRFYA